MRRPAIRPDKEYSIPATAALGPRVVINNIGNLTIVKAAVNGFALLIATSNAALTASQAVSNASVLAKSLLNCPLIT